MSKINLALVGGLLIVLSIGCKSLMPAKSVEKKAVPFIDLTTPGKGLDVKVELDKKHTVGAKIGKSGGSVSLSGNNGSKFVLDVPANALDTETEITMTAVKSLDGAPLDNELPTAVQLEPSGLLFKELVTLSVTPSKEIPVKDQIIFSYEGEGKDYHLAVIDPKSKEIKIRLMEFSGAGVGSGGDSAWAANLAIKPSDVAARIENKIGEYVQSKRREALPSVDDQANAELDAKVLFTLDQFEEEVVSREIAAAELDCKLATPALKDLLLLQKLRLFHGSKGTVDFEEKIAKLKKILEECRAINGSNSYRIVGGLDDFQTDTAVCDIMKPFILVGGGITMKISGGLSGKYSYTGPFNANGNGTYIISLPFGMGKPGTMTGSGSGEITGDKVYTGSGTEKYTLTPIEPCG